MSSPKSWFVQTGFGTILGPMPDDALLEMIRTGALLRTDQVREGLGDEWRIAADYPEMFNAAPFSLAIHDSGGSVAEKETPTISAPDFDPTFSRSKLRPPSLPTRNPPPVPVPDEPAKTPTPLPTEAVNDTVATDRRLTPIVEQPLETIASSKAPVEDGMIASWRSERQRAQEDLGTVSLAAEMSQAEAEEKIAPELPTNQFDDPTELGPVAVSEKRTSSRPGVHRPSFLDQIKGLEDGPRQRIETNQQKWERWRRSLPSWPVAVIVVLVVLALWVYWPRSSRGIYDRYVAIWEEWKARRTDFKDKEGWDRFLKDTEAELNDSVPWLEKNAAATDREKLLLLWIGRDCFRKMLKQPRVVGMPEEKQLQLLLTSVQEFYDSPGSESSTPDSAASTNAAPEQPMGLGMIDPKLPGPEKQTALPETPSRPMKPGISPAANPTDR